MLKSSNDIKATLEKHGTKVINALGAMVSALKTEDDAKLLAKISEVDMYQLYYIYIHNIFEKIAIFVLVLLRFYRLSTIIGNEGYKTFHHIR